MRDYVDLERWTVEEVDEMHELLDGLDWAEGESRRNAEQQAQASKGRGRR